jgi:hypothetical protein
MGVLVKIYRRFVARHLSRFGDDYAREALYGTIFNAAVARLDWLGGEVFFPTGAAANYSLLYVYLRVLEAARPRRVLEFGLGQSSRLSRAYARSRPEAGVRVVEHDARWLEIFSAGRESPANFEVHLAPLVPTELSALGVPGGEPRQWYESVPEGAFDLVLLDGPPRDRTFARAGILSILPERLADEFVLIVDDYDSETIRETCGLIRTRLRAAGREFTEFSVRGVKAQLCFVSPAYGFLATI